MAITVVDTISVIIYLFSHFSFPLSYIFLLEGALKDKNKKVGRSDQKRGVDPFQGPLEHFGVSGENLGFFRNNQIN